MPTSVRSIDPILNKKSFAPYFFATSLNFWKGAQSRPPFNVHEYPLVYSPFRFFSQYLQKSHHLKFVFGVKMQPFFSSFGIFLCSYSEMKILTKTRPPQFHCINVEGRAGPCGIRPALQDHDLSITSRCSFAFRSRSVPFGFPSSTTPAFL